jgi:hypothetical protein
MNIQSYKSSGNVNYNQTVKSNTGNINNYQQFKPKQDTVSFGAVSMGDLAKASDNSGVRYILKMIQHDIDTSAPKCLAKITQEKILPEKSWWDLLTIIEKYSSNVYQMPFQNQAKNVFACPQVVKEKITTISGDVIKSKELKIKLDQLLIESMNENTLVIAFKEGKSEEVFINKGYIDTSLTANNALYTLDEDGNIIMNNTSGKKQKIILNETVKDIVSILKDPFKLPIVDPLNINAIKITPEDVAYKRHAGTFQDLLTIDNVLTQAAHKAPNENFVSYNNFLDSIGI